MDLIAGCSAGSINTLVMATAENPREVVLDGTLERMWKDTQEWADDSVAMNLGAMMGLTPFFTRRTTYALMDKYFGKMRMKDLKQKVVTEVNQKVAAGQAPKDAVATYAAKVSKSADGAANYVAAGKLLGQAAGYVNQNVLSCLGFC